jgi:polyhydroxyalkanoate synthase
LDEKERRDSLFWVNQLVNATAPANYFWTNPVAVSKCLKSDGDSFQKGVENWIRDMEAGKSLVSTTDESQFKVGENIATTSGKVIFRNDLMELIQYAPAVDTVYPEPVVLIQPWINKYYILDLDAGKSMMKYLLDKGFCVFTTSWKNPTKEMRTTSFEDYMFDGAMTAFEAAARICGVDEVHAVGYCIGGTALSALLAWLNHPSRNGRSMLIRDWTLFASMVDFSDPGDIAAYINEKSIWLLEQEMEKEGFVRGEYTEWAFRMLKSDGLIWRYVVHNYLQGSAPPKSDVMYWNCDNTRLPEAMCSYYLRQFYLKNNLVKPDALSMRDLPIDLGRIRQPLYAVGTLTDHISPWKGTFQICNRIKGDVRYVLSGEGHITGIVNPPSPKSKQKYWAGPVKPGGEDPDKWKQSREIKKGSWWTDWAAWLAENSSAKREPPSMGSDRYPPIVDAPGTYVLER